MLALEGTDTLAAYATVTLPGVVKTVFRPAAEVGSLLILGGNNTIAIAHTQINTKGGVSTVTALPVFRTDEALNAGADLFLPGVQKSATRTTALHLQELGGMATTVTVESLDSEGRQLGSRTQSLTRYGNVEIRDVAATGVAAIRVRNSTPGSAINGYAVVHDTTTSDVLTLIPSPPGTGDLFFTTFLADVEGQEIQLFVGNSSAEAINVTATKSTLATGRRRAITSASGPEAIAADADTTLTIPPFGTRKLIVTAPGFVNVIGPAAVRATATVTVPRSAAAGAGGDTGRVGSGIVLVPKSRGLLGGQGWRFAGVEDSTAATVAAARPLTFRSTLVMTEVAGKTTRVRLTLRFPLPGGKPGDTASYSNEQVFEPNDGYRYTDLAAFIIGESREALGDLHDATLDVDVYGGANSGRIVAFLKMTDNGTGDVTVRHQ
jgi:hypothetical protein